MVHVNGMPKIVSDHPSHAYMVKYGLFLLSVIPLSMGMARARSSASKHAGGKRDVEPTDGSGRADAE